MPTRRVFVIADHGLSIVYFLQSDVVSTLLNAGVEVVLLTDDDIVGRIADRFGRPGLLVEGLRLKQAEAYAGKSHRELQWWLGFFRRVGGSHRINTEAMDAYIRQVHVEHTTRRRRYLYPAADAIIWLLRRSSVARKALVEIQKGLVPNLYGELFDHYRPDMLIANTPGWRIDRYIMREAHVRGIPNVAAIMGWDNPSSYAIPGAPTQWVTCWSEQQKDELVLGSDWSPERVNIGGIPSYDGYIRREWQVDRDTYFRRHRLDPERRLIAYACSFETFAPNIQNIVALARMIREDRLAAPSQLLIRLHPNHFMRDWPFLAAERERIFQLARETPHVHVVTPASIGGSLGHYSGEDVDEKASMMAHADVVVTVYSTMVVETAIHDRPIVSACLDVPGGWNVPKKLSLALSEIGDWPTHKRFRESGAGRVAQDEKTIFEAVNNYLEDPALDAEKRRSFVQDEITYADGSAGARTAKFLLSLL